MEQMGSQQLHWALGDVSKKPSVPGVISKMVLGLAVARLKLLSRPKLEIESPNGQQRDVEGEDRERSFSGSKTPQPLRGRSIRSVRAESRKNPGAR